MLYSHDAHRKNRERIWVVNVEKGGEFEIKLYRWPEEAKKAILETRDGKKTVKINQAHLRIGNVNASKEVTQDMKSANFTVLLKAGTTCLQGWFTENSTGRVYGTYSISLERTGPEDPVEVAEYRGSDPDRLLKE